MSTFKIRSLFAALAGLLLSVCMVAPASATVQTIYFSKLYQVSHWKPYSTFSSTAQGTFYVNGVVQRGIDYSQSPPAPYQSWELGNFGVMFLYGSNSTINDRMRDCITLAEPYLADPYLNPYGPYLANLLIVYDTSDIAYSDVNMVELNNISSCSFF